MLFSTHRKELMGISIILICLYHATIFFSENTLFLPIQIVKNLGFVGVDIFLLLSGLGLVYSRETNLQPLRTFYLKRFIRIIPAYWIIITLSLFSLGIWTDHITVHWLFFRYSTIGFWFDITSYGWYIPATFLFYLVFPLLNTGFKSFGLKFIIIGTLSALFCCYLAFQLDMFYLVIVLSRIPPFLFGIYVGHRLLNKQTNLLNRPISYSVSIASFGLVIFLVQYKGYNWTYDSGFMWYPLALTIVPIALSLSDIISRVLSLSGLIYLKRIVQFCGNYSLEIFLVHGLIYALGEKYKLFEANHILADLNYINLPEYLTYFIITLFLSYFLSKTCLPLQQFIIKPR